MGCTYSTWTPIITKFYASFEGAYSGRGGHSTQGGSSVIYGKCIINDAAIYDIASFS